MVPTHSVCKEEYCTQYNSSHNFSEINFIYLMGRFSDHHHHHGLELMVLHPIQLEHSFRFGVLCGIWGLYFYSWFFVFVFPSFLFPFLSIPFSFRILFFPVRPGVVRSS